MALHPNFSVTDPSAIHIGTSVTKQNTSKSSEKTVDIVWNDEKVEKSPQKSKRFSFLDILDIVNPLHHIPIIGSIYRHFTGDEIKGPARIAGGALFGGPIGAAVSGVDVVIAQQGNGEYIGDRVFASFMGGDKTPSAYQVPQEQQIALAEVIEEEAVPAETELFAEDEFLFEDFTTEAEEAERQRKIALARDNYLKSMGMTSQKQAQVSHLY